MDEHKDINEPGQAISQEELDRLPEGPGRNRTPSEQAIRVLAFRRRAKRTTPKHR